MQIYIDPRMAGPWVQRMKQLDVDVSSPVFVWNPYLTLANVTFDLDPCDLWHWTLRPLTARSLVKYTIQNHIIDMVTLTFIHDLDTINVNHHTKSGDPNQTVPEIWIIVRLSLSSHVQTDGKDSTSPPCISTSGLKKVKLDKNRNIFTPDDTWVWE